VPMILGPDRTRLSKRHGATSVLAYREMGYLPYALLNALARIGWSYGDQEKFTVQELIEKFSLENVGKSAGIFNPEKLLDLNARYIRESDSKDLAEALIPFLKRVGFKDLDKTQVTGAAETLRMRSKTLVDMAESARFYFEEGLNYDEKADRKFLKPEIAPLMRETRARIENMSEFTQKDLEGLFLSILDEKKIKLGDIAQPLRVALTGTSVSPGLFEVMEVLGKEKVLRRMDRALRHMVQKSPSL
jgi:glutamyl-tRNA synthetase